MANMSFPNSQNSETFIGLKNPVRVGLELWSRSGKINWQNSSKGVPASVITGELAYSSNSQCVTVKLAVQYNTYNVIRGLKVSLGPH